VQDNVGPNQGSIDDGDTTDDTTPTLIGSGGEPGDIVTVIDDGVEIGTAVVGDDGRWEFTPDPALTEGSHDIVVVIRDPAGNESEPSDPHTIIVDTTAPIAPTLDFVVDDQGAVTGNLVSGQITDDARPDLSGTAEPGSLVTIYDNGVPIGSVIATDGTWTFTPTLPLSNGPHSLTVTATDTAGNESVPTPGFDLDVIAGGAPTAPAIITVVDDQGASQGPVGQNQSTDDAQPTINGTGASGNVITVFANGLPLGTAIVDANGQWSFTPTTPLAEGLNNLTAQATDAAGNSSPTTGDYPINVDTVAPGAPVSQSLTDDVGAMTGAINAGDITDDANPTFTGTAEPGSVVVIYDGVNPIGSVTTDPTTGAWSFTPATALIDGPHSFSAQVVDSAGNVGPMGPSIPFTVDTSAVVISITSVADNEGSITGNLTSGQTTDDTTPTLNGQATPGGIVSIYDGANLLGTVIADATTGQWSFTTPVLSTGSHDLTATVSTAAGGESAPTAVFETIIDTTAPGIPVIGNVADDVGINQDPIADGGITDDTTPTLSGDGLQAGDTVEVYDGTDLLGTAIVKADGTWAYTPTTPLNDGSHEFTVVAVDPAGNASVPSDSWTVVVDTATPIASAVVDSMSKDSGADSGDFVTNDGSAGRLIQGSLTAALGVGEKVQVSTDGGATWVDAIVNGDKWSFIDQSSHNADWKIQTRVLDDAGNTNQTSQEISLDTAIDAPTSISWDGSSIEVGFDPAGVALGDSVHLIIDGITVEHVLTQTDIDAGKVTMPWDSNLQGNADSIDAAIVDGTGNVSQYIEYVKGITTPITEGFNNEVTRSFTLGETVDFGHFVLTAEKISGGWSGATGFGSFANSWVDRPSSQALVMIGGSQIKLEVAPGQLFDSISLTVGDFNNVESIEAVFYDQNDIEVYRAELTPGETGLRFDLTQELPYGLSFSSVTLESGGDAVNGFWIDDIKLGTTGYEQGGTLHDAEALQDITQSAAFYGGDADNVFSIATVDLLDDAASSIQGGSGIDTLKLTDQGQVLDLTKLGEKVSSVEVIDLTGTGNNTLNLSLGDVLEQGETSLFTADDTTQMMIKGNAGDVVNLDDLLPGGTDPGDWATAGTATVAGVTYNVFQHSTLDAQLLIQDGVTTNLV
uniref:Ig-like domain-containing protein n=1 Tax=Pseudomonas fluorescens TaxID=294 RepID=UPI000AB7EF3E